MKFFKRLKDAVYCRGKWWGVGSDQKPTWQVWIFSGTTKWSVILLNVSPRQALLKKTEPNAGHKTYGWPVVGTHSLSHLLYPGWDVTRPSQKIKSPLLRIPGNIFGFLLHQAKLYELCCYNSLPVVGSLNFNLMMQSGFELW